MKIRGKSSSQSAAGISPIYVPPEAARKVNEAEETSKPAEDVSVNISDNSKEVSKAKEALKTLPDVRMEKISTVRELIDSGNYHRDSYELAKRIVNEALLESIRLSQRRVAR